MDIVNPATAGAGSEDTVIPWFRIVIEEANGSIKEERIHRNAFVLDDNAVAETPAAPANAPTTGYTSVAESGN